jgi:hypothetical protein
MMLRDNRRERLRRRRWIRRQIPLAIIGSGALALQVGAGAAQELPPGGGPIPELRRGADGQTEILPANPGTRPGHRRHSTAPAAIIPKADLPPATRDGATPAVRRSLAVEPEITVTPNSPHVPDTTPRGAIVASYSVKMSDGSPFKGAVKFGPPYYDGNGVFALSGDHIVVNPKGPGLGPNKTSVTTHFTLVATP